MAGKTQISGKLARELAEKYPSAPSLQLGRMLRRDNPEVYASVNSARAAITYVRGERGGPGAGGSTRPVRHITLPDPEPSDWTIYDLPTAPRRWLVLADVHVPYHDPAALEAAIRFAADRKTRCRGLLLLGDYLDFHQLSKFEKDPRRRNVREELDTARELLDALRRELRLTHIVWRGGNHEYRLDRFMFRRAPELLDVANFDLAGEVGMTRKRDLWVPRGMPLKHHDLYLLHGDEWRGGISSPVNPARGAYLKAHVCCLVGHQHRTSEHTEPDAAGTTTTCWSVGCMCDLHPAYARMNRWNHGFATLTSGRRGRDWRIDNYRVVRGEVA